MGLWDKVKGWGSKVINPANLVSAAKIAGTIGYNSTKAITSELAAVPETIHSVVTDPKTRFFAGQVRTVVRKNLSIPLAVSILNTLLLNLNHLYNSSPEDDSSTNEMMDNTQVVMRSVEVLVWLGGTIGAVVQIYTLGFVAKDYLNTQPTNQLLSICDEKCETPGFIDKFQIPVAFVVTDITLWALAFKYQQLAEYLSVLNYGRGIIDVGVPADQCNKHHLAYLKENFEFVVIAGLTHELLSQFTSELIESDPNFFLSFFVNKLMFLAMMNLAAHMALPPATRETRNIPDPIAFYQDMVTKVFKLSVFFVQKSLPFFLKQPPSNFSWDHLFDAMGNILQKFEQMKANPFIKKWIAPTSTHITPKHLHGVDEFLQDEILAPHLQNLKTAVLKEYDEKEKKCESIEGKALLSLPTWLSARLASMFTDINKDVSKFGLNKLSSREFMLAVYKKILAIQGMHTTPAPKVEANLNAPSMRDDESIAAHPVIKRTAEELEKKEKALALVINKPPETIEKSDSVIVLQKAKTKPLADAARLLHFKSAPASTQSAAALLRQRTSESPQFF